MRAPRPGRHAFRTRSRRPWVAAGVLTAVGTMVLGTGVVNAAINSPAVPGEVHGCVADKGGAVRIINFDASCRNDERFITWNKSGRKGAQGPQGPQGPQGVQGIPGTNGTNGVDGADALPLQFRQKVYDENLVLTSTWEALSDGGAPGDDLFVALEPGTWVLDANIRGGIRNNTGGLVGETGCHIVAALFRGVANVLVPGTVRTVLDFRGPKGPVGSELRKQATGPISHIIEVGPPGAIIVVKARTEGTCTNTSAGIVTNDNGVSTLRAVKIGD